MNNVIGSGVIANRFADYSLQSKYLLFAGRVNDSGIMDESVIQNEELNVKAALSVLSDRTFLYFSSCDVLDMIQTPYGQQKVRIETLIQNSTKNYIIFRVPQVLGLSVSKSNLNMPFLVDAIFNRKPFDLERNACQNLIDIDDVHEIVSEILRRDICHNKIINIASPNQTSVLQLIEEIEGFLGIKSNYVVIDSTSTSSAIDISDIYPIINSLNIEFNDNYIKSALNKYFGHLMCSPKLISIIVPTYNEEKGIAEFYRRIKSVLINLLPRFTHEIIFVNDSSTDNTLQQLQVISANDSAVKLINFSRNFGNQIGITAGIDFSKGDIAIVIDDDLQDPPEIILNLIAKWDKGYKVVYGIRPNRKGVNKFFKLIAEIYYRVLGKLSDIKIPNDTGDFRLIDRVVINTLKNIREENRYYRGLVAWVGFPQIGVFYERDKRYAGVSTFSFTKYIKFAISGLTSFTEKPLYFSSLAGLMITLISFLLAVFVVISRIFDPSTTIRGWTSMVVIALFFGGIQLLSIGILGVYIGKIYREIKKRPLYIVERTWNIEQPNDEENPP